MAATPEDLQLLSFLDAAGGDPAVAAELVRMSKMGMVPPAMPGMPPAGMMPFPMPGMPPVPGMPPIAPLPGMPPMPPGVPPMPMPGMPPIPGMPPMAGMPPIPMPSLDLPVGNAPENEAVTASSENSGVNAAVAAAMKTNSVGGILAAPPAPLIGPAGPPGTLPAPTVSGGSAPAPENSVAISARPAGAPAIGPSLPVAAPEPSQPVAPQPQPVVMPVQSIATRQAIQPSPPIVAAQPTAESVAPKPTQPSPPVVSAQSIAQSAVTLPTTSVPPAFAGSQPVIERAAISASPQAQLGQSLEIPVCKNWLRGACANGPACLYQHPTKISPGMREGAKVPPPKAPPGNGLLAPAKAVSSTMSAPPPAIFTPNMMQSQMEPPPGKAGYGRVSIMGQTMEPKGKPKAGTGSSLAHAFELPRKPKGFDLDQIFETKNTSAPKVQKSEQMEEQVSAMADAALSRMKDPNNSSNNKLYMGNIPRGTTEAQIKNECTKYGQVISMFLSSGEKGESGWAVVAFATADMASHALQTMLSQPSWVSNAKMEVRYADADEQKLREQKHRTESGRSRSRDRSRKKDKKKKSKKKKKNRSHSSRSSRSSRSSSSSRSRKKKNKSRSASRRRFKSKSRSKPKKRARLGFDATEPVPEIEGPSSQKIEEALKNHKPPIDITVQPGEKPRLVAVRGTWAHYIVGNGESYYANIMTSATSYEKPIEFEQAMARRQGEDNSGETTLFVLHLPKVWGDEDLKHAFSPYGSVIRADVQKDNLMQSRGYGFVTYPSQAEACLALNAMSGYAVLGKRLEVRRAVRKANAGIRMR